jgi:hypothetical protein
LLRTEAANATGTWLDVRVANLGRALSRPWLLWLIALVFWGRVAVIVSETPDRSDGTALVAAARTYLGDPAHLYTAVAEHLARFGIMPTHGWAGPPGAMLLLAPFALLPGSWATLAWTLADAAAMLGALAFVYATTRPTSWRRPLFFLIAGYFPPLFADLDTGQMGGFLLLLSCAAIWLAARRPGWAGALAGLAAGLKLYPAGILAGVAPRRLRRFGAGLAGAAFALTAVAFLPLGAGAPGFWLFRVLLPALRSPLPDCAIDSPRTLINRTIGGEAYPYINASGGMTWVRLPLHEPALAAVLGYVVLAAIVAAVVWAAARSDWHPVYGPSLGLALGALLPGEVNIYQMLPLLPLLLVTAMRAGETGNYRVLAALGVALAAMVRQPCFLVFPDLLTLAALSLFAICVWNNGLFRASPNPGGGARHGDQRPGEIHVDRARHVEGAQRARQGDPDRPLGDEQPGRARPAEEGRSLRPDVHNARPLRPHP